MNNFWKFTIIYGLGFLLLRGISFCLLPIYTNFLSQYNAGIIFLVYTILAFLNPVFAYGMNAALFKFYNSNFSKKVVLSTSFISLFVSSFIFITVSRVYIGSSSILSKKPSITYLFATRALRV